jgi:single-strand DNA-binding protein
MLNRFEAIGNLTFDPELRYTPNGAAVTDLRIAVNTKSKDREEVLFITATAWNVQAENACKYLRKGSKVFIAGPLKEDTWDDKTTGERRSQIKMFVGDITYLDPPGARNVDAGAPSQARPSRSGPDPAPVTGNDIPF